jgi:hypothetical protein
MIKLTVSKNEFGTVRYKNEEGRLHHPYGPAVECSSWSKQWYLNGKRHRTDGPAIQWSDGSKEWFLNGKQHRTDGPAAEYADGAKHWYLDGKRHRTDGPAIEFSDGAKKWFLNGTQVTEEYHKRHTSPVREMTISELEKELGYSIKVVKEEHNE